MCHDREDSSRHHLAGIAAANLCNSSSPGRDTPDSVAAARELSADPALSFKLVQGMQVPLEECIPEEEVVW